MSPLRLYKCYFRYIIRTNFYFRHRRFRERIGPSHSYRKLVHLAQHHSAFHKTTNQLRICEMSQRLNLTNSRRCDRTYHPYLEAVLRWIFRSTRPLRRLRREIDQISFLSGRHFYFC